MSQAYERPFRPTEITDSTATSFSLLSMAHQLMTEDAFEKNGTQCPDLSAWKRFNCRLDGLEGPSHAA